MENTELFKDVVADDLADKIATHYEHSKAGEEAIARAVVIVKEFELSLMASPLFERAVGDYGATRNGEIFAARIIAGIGYDRFVIFAQNFPLLVPLLVNGILEYAYETGRMGQATAYEGWDITGHMYKRAGVEAKK